MTEAEYKQLVRPHVRAVRQLLTDLDFFLQDVGPVNVLSITSRIKDFGSATRKSLLLRMPVEDLQDLAGIRVVAATRQEVHVLARFFYRGQESEDLKIERDKNLSRESGYRARHIVAVMRPRYTRSVHPARIEIQLMTVLQHAFNFMSRAWVYKSDSRLPAEWQSRFSGLAEDVRRLDRLAARLGREITKAAHSLEDEAALTPMSYQQLVKKVFGEDISLDDAVDSCRLMADVGCRANGAVRIFFEDSRIAQLRDRFMRATGPGAALRDMASTKHAFWLLWGTRYQAANRLLDDFGQT